MTAVSKHNFYRHWTRTKIFFLMLDSLKSRNKVDIAMLRVMPTRDLLVPHTKRSFQIMVGTLPLQLQCL